jgi:hypothetical protein
MEFGLVVFVVVRTNIEKDTSHSESLSRDTNWELPEQKAGKLPAPEWVQCLRHKSMQLLTFCRLNVF